MHVTEMKNKKQIFLQQDIPQSSIILMGNTEPADGKR